MGFWDDLKMGTGFAPKTQDFVDRTARTIERTQGSNAASTYSSQMTNKVNENTGQNFDNNYTASEGSQAVVNQFKDNDDDNSAGGVRNISEGNIFSALGETLNEENRSTMFGGQLKDYSNLSNDRFQANNLTQEGNTVGYSKYGKSAGSIITVTSDGKFKLTPSDAVAQDLGVAATDFDTLDEVFGMLDRYNDEPANTFARYNAATQQGLRDKDATVYANDTSLNNPAEALEEFGPVYEPQPTDPTDLETTTTEEPEPILPFFDPQDSDNLLKLKRLDVEVTLAMEAYQADPNNYNARYDLNGDGTNSLNDVVTLQQMYAGPNRGGIQKNQIFADLILSDVNPSIAGQTNQLSDNIAAPVAVSGSINSENGYYDLTFNDIGGGSYTVSGRTEAEARANARTRGDEYINQIMGTLNDTGQLSDQERQTLRDALAWKQTYYAEGQANFSPYTDEDRASAGVSIENAASTLNTYEIDNLLAPTFSADPVTGTPSTLNVQDAYTNIINDDTLSDDAKKYSLASLMGANLTSNDVATYDITGDGTIDQDDISTVQTNYLRGQNSILQDPSKSSLWEYSSSYNVGEDERYVNFNQSGQGNTVAQTNIGELYQEGDRYKFKTKDGLVVREFGNVQDAVRFVSPNAGYEFGKFKNESTEYDSYSPYYFTNKRGERMDMSEAEIAEVDRLRAQGFTEQQINDSLKQQFDYRVIKDVTGQTGLETQTEQTFMQKPDRPDSGEYDYKQSKPQDIYTRGESTDQQAGVYQAQPYQPQFVGQQVDPATGTFMLGQQQPMMSQPSMVGSQFNVPQISTSVLGPQQQQQQATSFTNYGPRFTTYNEGGVVPQQQLQSQGTFGGFKPQAMQKIANNLGYMGDMSGFEQYLSANPDKKQKMDTYTQKAMQMAKGGMAKKVLHANDGTYVYGQSDPRRLGQQYIPQTDFSTYTEQVPIYEERYDDEGNVLKDDYGQPQKFATGEYQTVQKGYNLSDVMATQAVYPGLPQGATVTPMGVNFQAGQFLNPYSGQVYGNVGVPTALAGTAQAGMIQPTGANLMQAQTGYGAMNQLMSGVGAAQAGYGPEIQAAQGQSSLNIQAAQGQAYMMQNPVQRQLQSGELISGAADAQKAAAFTEQIEAATAEPSAKATVQGQLEGLMSQFEEGDSPAWAAGAMRAAMGAMSARGLGASSLAGQAVVQAAMESALPVAMADAQTQSQFEQQNLSNKQQRAMLAAQQRAQFMGQEFDQAFQARVANASKVSDVANMNFTAEQQVALENSRAANTMNLANLSNRQAGVMAEAAAIANMDQANLNNRQMTAVQNAQNFLQVDMANLSNRQQSELFRAQQRAQALFTDQAAENAAAQFNATSQNQVDQFFASLTSQTSQFNASQTNAQAQFNAGQTNVLERFNAEINNQREQFNAQNRLIIDQSNAQWRREVATMDTAAVNRANELNAEALLGVSRDAYNNLWSYYRDNMEWAWTSAEGEKNRMSNLAIAQLQADNTYDLAKMKEDYANNVGFGSLIGKILTSDLTNTLGGSILGDWFGWGS